MPAGATTTDEFTPRPLRSNETELLKSSVPDRIGVLNTEECDTPSDVFLTAVFEPVVENHPMYFAVSCHHSSKYFEPVFNSTTNNEAN